jgi:hypothetical protein
MKRTRHALLGACLATLSWSPATLNAALGAARPSAPVLESIASLETRDAIHWTLKTDTGLLVAYADGAVHVFDLLAGGKRIGEPIPLPGANRRWSAVHVSGTNLLMIAANGASPQSDAAETVPAKRTYLINLASSSVLWSTESFDPPLQTLLFPKADVLVVRSGRKGDRFAAFEVATGRRLWSSTLRAQYAERKDGMLEVLGVDSRLIEPSSGQERWGFGLPSGEHGRVLVFPTRDRMVLWKGNDFEGFEMPARDTRGLDSTSPGTVAPKSLWKFEADDRMPARCVAMQNCWARVISGERVVIVSKRHVELLDAVTGRAVWKRRKNGIWREFPVSPSGRTGVEFGWGDPVFIDVETGDDAFHLEAPKLIRGKKQNHAARWLDESELLVVYYDNAWRPRDLARYDVGGRKLLWSHALPDPAAFRLTAKQKGGIVGGVFAAVALGVAFAAAPAAAFPNIVPPILPFPASGRLGMNLSESGSMPDEAIEASESRLPRGILAFDRREERWRRIRETEAHEIFVVSGDDDFYRVSAVDLVSGNERPVLEYRRKKVHFMDFDVASGLIISTEENKRMLRLLAPAPELREKSSSKVDVPGRKQTD